MSKSRREFLVSTSLGVVGTAMMGQSQNEKPAEPPPGAPPAFGTAPPVGPTVSPATFAEAEKLVRVELTAAERSQVAGNWRSAMAQLYERRTGPRKVNIEPAIAPYSQWNPILPGQQPAPRRDQFTWTHADPGPLPSRDEDIAFAP